MNIMNLSVEEMIVAIDEPNRTRCWKLLTDNRARFEAARGSSHNHQAWAGGYLDHIGEVMRIALLLYPALCYTKRVLSFSLSDSLLILFLHDVEKPWRFSESGEKIVDLISKEQRAGFRDTIVETAGIQLTPAQRNAFAYVEGEKDDYSNERRVMNELAAFCHMCDVWSARGWYDYPRRQERTGGAS